LNHSNFVANSVELGHISLGPSMLDHAFIGFVGIAVEKLEFYELTSISS
jgi:hypothetical protein